MHNLWGNCIKQVGEITNAFKTSFQTGKNEKN